ncbi:cation:proton antiporter [Candidatus Micrarchaeota archaeon]|nr:cation:proton antiporter [Candidatus Micrarchaeota archaeon]
MTSLDLYLTTFVLVSFIALITCVLLNLFRQPSLIAYIITGLIIGSHGFGFVSDQNLIAQLGNLGLVLLLFFIGMQIRLYQIISNWKVAIIGTLFQILISVGLVGLLGIILCWSLNTIVLLGFVISLSSTAVIVKLLESMDRMGTNVGRDVLSILLVQDLAVIPMLIIINALLRGPINFGSISLQLVGFTIVMVFVYWMAKKKETLIIPFKKRIKFDFEFQVLAAIIICFGFAWVTEFFYLSAALGAFIAGMFLASIKETRWATESLMSFKVLFLALFFVSIGLLIDIEFISANLLQVLLLVFFVLLTNTFINAAIFKLLGKTWRYSLYLGSLLAQIGEFSFLLAALGLKNGIIQETAYDMTIAVIAISLAISPIWISIFSRLFKVKGYDVI